MTKILKLLTTGKGKGVAGTSSHVEISLNQTDDTPAFPPRFTSQMMSSPHLAGTQYPQSFPIPESNQTSQQAAQTSDPVSTPVIEHGRKISEDQGSKRRLEFLEERL